MEKLIAARISELQTRIKSAAARCGRNADEIKLVAVSKTFPAARLIEAAQSGQRIFGENYVQEAVQKVAALRAAGLEVEFHFIGKLQSNKVRDVTGLFSLIHSVHKFDLARKLSDAALAQELRQDILVQLNVSAEESKSGADSAVVEDLLGQIKELPGVRLCGLMCIGEYIPEDATRDERVRDFVKLRQIRDSVERSLKIQLPELSMGMSHDFELAIEEGATIVRVGSAIFGSRVTHA